MNNKFWGMLGLAMRAGKLQVGEARAFAAIMSNEEKLILVANDASANTAKKVSDKGSYRNIPIISPADRFQMGAAVGKKIAVVMAVTEDGFAQQLLKLAEN